MLKLEEEKEVVPLTGHVDRNAVAQMGINGAGVVPLTGHVDRNIAHDFTSSSFGCRAPHGARG